jgi:hypothetical protein
VQRVSGDNDILTLNEAADVPVRFAAARRQEVQIPVGSGDETVNASSNKNGYLHSSVLSPNEQVNLRVGR